MIFHIDTNATSLILKSDDNGRLILLHYGRRIKKRGEALYASIDEKRDVMYGNMIKPSADEEYGLEDICLAYSGRGRGDYREPVIDIVTENGSCTCDPLFVSYEATDEKPHLPGLPSAYDDTGTAKTHIFTLRDEHIKLTVRLYITAFFDSDVITERVEIENASSSSIKLKRALSAQLDLPRADFDFVTFTGAWGQERMRHDAPLKTGVSFVDSKLGYSSCRANPLVMLKACDATELSGDCYAMNLIYSGDHYEAAEVTHYGKTRLVSGINPHTFSWTLKGGETFFTPEAVMTYSGNGPAGASRNMHRFVKKHIVRGYWRDRERPVLINNWEGTMFDFDEGKILSIAKTAASLGCELFVLDDGWFGARSDDTKGLGDWTVNRKKLPHGMSGLCERIKAMGMSFGLWVEPEMVNPDSELYRAHPDWAITSPERSPATGRNQLVLDFANPDVCDHITGEMSRVFSSADISYIKWDCNRNMSDVYSSALLPDEQEGYNYRYMRGLYSVLERLTAAFPHILFESCASGGNRFDLGMLCYMPQVWTSDDTDPIARLHIQYGTSMGYPQSTMGAHVSASPTHSTLRATPVETRFNAAAVGLLGYEMDLTELTPFDKNCIKQQIEYYKAHRRLLQFGELYWLKTPIEHNRCIVMTVDESGDSAMACFYQQTAIPSHTHDIMPAMGLDPDAVYEVTGRKQYISLRAFGGLVKHVMPVSIKPDGAPMAILASRYMFAMNDESYTVPGDMFMDSGLRLDQQFGGTGYNERIRALSDFGSRMYEIKRKG